MVVWLPTMFLLSVPGLIHLERAANDAIVVADPVLRSATFKVRKCTLRLQGATCVLILG